MSAGRFAFKLGRLLTLRERSEDDAAAAYGVAAAKADQLRAGQAQVLAHAERTRATLMPGAGCEGSAGEARATQQLIEHAEASAAWFAQEVAAADAATRVARIELAVRMRERRVLERLRERRHEDWRASDALHARGAMDAIATRGGTRPMDGTP